MERFFGKSIIKKGQLSFETWAEFFCRDFHIDPDFVLMSAEEEFTVKDFFELCMEKPELQPWVQYNLSYAASMGGDVGAVMLSIMNTVAAGNE